MSFESKTFEVPIEDLLEFYKATGTVGHRVQFANGKAILRCQVEVTDGEQDKPGIESSGSGNQQSDAAGSDIPDDTAG